MTVEIKGNQALLVTPFTENGEFDEESYLRLIDFVMEKGVHGVLALGTTGEFFTMPAEEWQYIMDVTGKRLRGKTVLGFGCGHAGTTEAVKMAQYADKVGADYLMVSPPYYFPNTNEGVIAHYEAIAKAVGAEVMLYDGGGGQELPISQMVEIAKRFSNVNYVKLFNPVVEKVAQVKEYSDGNLIPFAGHSHVFYLQLLYGAAGMTTAASNIFPRENSDIFEAIEAGERDRARDIHNKIMAPWNDICFPSPLQFIQCYKLALKWKGIINSAEVRLPLRQVDQVRQNELRAVLEYLGFLG